MHGNPKEVLKNGLKQRSDSCEYNDDINFIRIINDLFWTYDL